MKSVLTSLAVFIALCVPFVLYAQDYTEASGQTTVFELKAGAKAGWDQTGIVIYSTSINRSQPVTARLLPDHKTILVNGIDGSTFSFEIFSINGSRIRCTNPEGQSKKISLTAPLVPGYYLARIRQNGIILNTSTFFVSR